MDTFPGQTHLDMVTATYKLYYLTSHKWRPLLGGHFFLTQGCPVTGSLTVLHPVTHPQVVGKMSKYGQVKGILEADWLGMVKQFKKWLLTAVHNYFVLANCHPFSSRNGKWHESL